MRYFQKGFSPALNWRKKSWSIGSFKRRSFSRLISSFADHHHKSLSLDMILAIHIRNYRTFQLEVTAYCVNSAESLDFLISGEIKKLVYQKICCWYFARRMQHAWLRPWFLFDTFSKFLACNFNENLAQVFSCDIQKNILASNFNKNETPAQVFNENSTKLFCL